MTPTASTLPGLYLEDETAWLDRMVELLTAGDFSELDYANLREFLSDYAARDRREMASGLCGLLTAILRQQQEAERHDRSLKSSILMQRYELESTAESAVLRRHAELILAEEFHQAVKIASAYTGLPADKFPRECPYTLEALLAFKPE